MNSLSKPFLVLLAILMSSSAFAGDDPWQVLKRVTHRRCIAFAVKAWPACVEGRIKRLTDDNVEIVPCREGASPVTIPRKDVLRVTNKRNVYFVPYLLYSGRSSWSDVTSLALVAGKRMKLVTTDGQQLTASIQGILGNSIRVVTDGATLTLAQQKIAAAEGEPAEYESIVRVTDKAAKKHLGKIAAVSPTEITLLNAGKKVTIWRQEIARVELMQDRPMSDSLDYAAFELGGLVYLDPEAWSYEMSRRIKLPVRVYEAGLPEDDSALQVSCAD